MARLDKRNVAKYWWDAHVPGLSLMRADFTSHDYARHTHDAFVIAVTERGAARISSRNTLEVVSPATLFVSNPEEPQSAAMGESRRWRYRSFYLTRPAIDAVARGLGIEAVPYFMRNVFDDAELIEGFGRLHRTLEDGLDGFRKDELLVTVFGALFRRYGSGGGRVDPAPRDRSLVGRAVDLLQARHAESLRLEEIAREVGLTSFQLIGLFRRTVGLTPHAYLIHVRLNAACRLLRRGHPLAETALAAGFCDQSAFTRHFKRCFGITPLQFAEAARSCRETRRSESAISDNTPNRKIA